MQADYLAASELRKALRRLARFTEEAALAHDLTPKRYELLLHIQVADDADAPATVTSLCETLQTSQSSVTQLIDAAARAGLLTRTTHPTDRRSSHIHLTQVATQRLRGCFLALGPERERLAEVIDHHFLGATPLP